MVFIIEEISNTCFRLRRIITTSLDIIPAVSSILKEVICIFTMTEANEVPFSSH